ncbi:hypothetical protein PBRA_009317 [Plasmodiophora brassicae]|uniref:3-hydroxyacyl-CoA dehydrogenase n=1 Tax=Plasmodiophora brassicae TaxID=37360 RepID=A0A0G4J6Z1_PLABS|nr:hypothetical protein PBRA_009317 [Plasmodiophora brassicae]
MVDASGPQRVVVIGSGLIGKSWAIMFARAGFTCDLYDVNADLVDPAVHAVRAALESVDAPSRIRPAKGKCTLCDLARVVRGAVHIQECVPEDLALKQAVFTSIGLALHQHADDVPPELVVASSTSNLPMSAISSAMLATYQPACVVCHPINPPTAIPLVEIVPGGETAPSTVERARARMSAIGQRPVVLRNECDGFILNRLQYALLAEAIRLVQSGVASPEDVDVAVTHGLARRWSFIGPFQTIDMNAPGGVADYFARYGASIRGIIAQQDNAVAWAPETLQAIDDAMRRVNGPVDRLPERCKWRDLRLALLDKHLSSSPQ